MSVWLNMAAALALVVITADLAAGQDSLSAARELYAGAAYEDALAILNRLRVDVVRAEDARAIDQYRAFCLLALGRASDAERAIESVIAVQPSYEPTEGDVSPRVRAAFSEVRRRMLPTIVQQWYASAKASYDRKEYGAAVSGFTQVLDVLTDPDVASAVNQPPLSDIRTLAAGFRDLSVAAAAPPPPPPPPPPPAPEPPPAAPAPARSPRIYGPGDPNVVPPAVVRQSLPPMPQQMQKSVSSLEGSLEIVIDETGAVETVLMKVPFSPLYDRLAVAAAVEWRYKPATVGGVPVKYRKVVQIAFKR
jgi:tetratricopeptide (TPR) repeat protein